jgi:acyl carrier protein
MSAGELKESVLRVLGEIAPEADLAAIAPDVSIRDQIDIDSMDFLNFVIGIHEALGIDIPETDYPQLATLESCVAYLADRRPE